MCSRLDYRVVLRELNLLEDLVEYQPTVIGTPPLGIDIDSSDIDIACTAPDLSRFRRVARNLLGDRADFQASKVTKTPQPAVRVAFNACDWEIELFCQTLPIAEQWGVRHFLIERRLLELQPGLKPEVIALKRSGLKTEPAFAALLNLDGDPYESLLELEGMSDAELARLLD